MGIDLETNTLLIDSPKNFPKGKTSRFSQDAFPCPRKRDTYDRFGEEGLEEGGGGDAEDIFSAFFGACLALQNDLPCLLFCVPTVAQFKPRKPVTAACPSHFLNGPGGGRRGGGSKRQKTKDVVQPLKVDVCQIRLRLMENQRETDCKTEWVCFSVFGLGVPRTDLRVNRTLLKNGVCRCAWRISERALDRQRRFRASKSIEV